MRLFSLLPMILAAIFFASSVSAHHKCAKGKSLGGKVYQVCKSWRVDQGGPMPTNMMQACRNELCQDSEDWCFTNQANEVYNEDCVTGAARQNTKNALGYWP